MAQQVLGTLRQRFLVTVSYYGGRFGGWADQPELLTVCGAINSALDNFAGVGNHSGAVGSSRTDKGVHALGNTFHVDIGRRDQSLRPFVQKEVVGGLNFFFTKQGLAEDVRVIEAVECPDDFHARFSAKGREYVYRIIPNVSKYGNGQGTRFPLFESQRAWVLEGHSLDVGAMRAATKGFLGEHDFTSFRGPSCCALSPVRRIDSLEVCQLVAQSIPTSDQISLRAGFRIAGKARRPYNSEHARHSDCC